jgi:Rad3-related DNA helicase
MTWSLYEIDKSGEVEKHRSLNPLKFSNGKSQEDVVKEVLDSIKKGNKIIFIHGVCGSGKSVIALNIARKLGKASIVVPGKNLQSQYKKDYEGNKYLLNDKNQKLKISVITGRKNHKCKFLEDNEHAIPKIRKEVDSNLNDIFAFDEKDIEEKKRKDKSADVWDLPCKIEIKEKNWKKLKEYIKQNKKVNPIDFNNIKEVSRSAVGCACPYYSPVLPAQFEIKHFADSKKKTYNGISNTKFIIHQGIPGCKFYEQFNSYLDSDVIVFNSSKYVLESALNRKPETEVEIIDECDEFLDKFSNQKTINLDRLQNSLIYAVGYSEKFDKAVNEISSILQYLKKDARILDAMVSNGIIPLKKTGVYDLLKVFLDTPEFLEDIDDESYLLEVEETARMFGDFLDESYVTVSKKDNQISLSVVTTNLAKRFKEMVDKNKIIVMMSGTLHSEYVLKNIFGVNDFKIIEAETKPQGIIEIKETGLEMDCRYSNFQSGKFTRGDYLKSLSKCIEVAKKPTLVHINAFADLPSEKELEEYDIDNLISREKLKELQGEDNEGEMVEKFKKGQTTVLFSTRASRGIDFPGEQCNSIVFTKYPNPNIQDAFWKILNQTKPQDYWEFYKDKARRELWQKVYRGVRSEKDHVYVLSPDIRILDAFRNSS